MTTFEKLHNRNLIYLKNLSNRFYNPFDKGFKENWKIFLGLGDNESFRKQCNIYSLIDFPEHPLYSKFMQQVNEKNNYIEKAKRASIEYVQNILNLSFVYCNHAFNI